MARKQRDPRVDPQEGDTVWPHAHSNGRARRVVASWNNWVKYQSRILLGDNGGYAFAGVDRGCSLATWRRWCKRNCGDDFDG